MADVIAPRAWRQKTSAPITVTSTYDDGHIWQEVRRLGAELERLKARPAAEVRPALLPDISGMVQAAVDEAMSRIVLPAAPVAARQDDDMPDVLRKMAAERGVDVSRPAPGPSASDVISALNDIETRAMQAIEALARRVDEISSRLDLEPITVDTNGNKEAIRTLTDWLKSIEGQASHADQMTAMLAAEIARLRSQIATPPPPTEPRDEPVPDPPRVEPQNVRVSAASRVTAAAKLRRNELIGIGADSRDVRQRLAEAAFNAGTGHETSISHLQALAHAYSMDWNELRKALVERHDTATAAVVATASIEAAAAIRLAGAGEHEIEMIADEAIAAIGRVGE